VGVPADSPYGSLIFFFARRRIPVAVAAGEHDRDSRRRVLSGLRFEGAQRTHWPA
jgi:hypothetical protein